MSKEVSLIILGVLVAVLPYLGFPGSWRTIMLVVLGVLIVSIGILMRRETLSRGDTKTNSFFVDNRQQKSETTHESGLQERSLVR